MSVPQLRAHLDAAIAELANVDRAVELAREHGRPLEAREAEKRAEVLRNRIAGLRARLGPRAVATA